MALKKGDKVNFEALKRAAKAGDLALVESKCAVTGEYRAVLAAVFMGEDGEYNIVPFGHLCTGDPYEQYVDPIIAMESDNHG